MGKNNSSWLKTKARRNNKHSGFKVCGAGAAWCGPVLKVIKMKRNSGKLAEKIIDTAAMGWPMTFLHPIRPHYNVKLRKYTEKGTIDRCGTICGVPVAFDIKSTIKGRWTANRSTLPPHELDALVKSHRAGQVAFVLAWEMESRRWVLIFCDPKAEKPVERKRGIECTTLTIPIYIADKQKEAKVETKT